MKKSFLSALFLTTILFISCCNKEIEKPNSSKDISIIKSNLLKSTAQNRFGNNYKFVYNNDSNYVLCLSFDKIKSTVPQTEFFVFDKNENEIILEDKVVNGEVNWIGNYKIEVKRQPGIVQKYQNPNPNRIYLFNVKTRNKSN